MIELISPEVITTMATEVVKNPSWSIPIPAWISGAVGTIIVVLGYFMKRLINGTAKSIQELKDKKVDDSVCILREEITKSLYVSISDNLKEIKENQKDTKQNLEDLSDTVTGIRIFLKNGNKWDGITERRRN